MQTSVRVTAQTRDELARLAADELGGASLEQALRVLLFEHRTRAALAALAALTADQAAAGVYRADAQALAEVDVAVRE